MSGISKHAAAALEEALIASIFIISGCAWWDNLSAYSYHANLQQQDLATIELKTKQLNGA